MPDLISVPQEILWSVNSHIGELQDWHLSSPNLALQLSLVASVSLYRDTMSKQVAAVSHD